ncbi:MAG: rhodanese-like domain-containing protein [Magnetospirillum sp.]|nr:rhodanese-like domain-containing protein [Magnetospirillum sp.]
MFHAPRRWLAVATIMLLAVWGSVAAAQEAVVSAPEARALVAAGKMILVDVRTPQEWRQTGVPAGAKRVNMHNPQGPEAFVDELLAAVGGDKAAPIGVICRVGNRSTQVQRYLIAKGFTDVTNVKEGMMGGEAGPGWLRRGLPVTACTAC